MGKLSFLLSLFLSFCIINSFAQENSQPSPEIVVHLLDYLAKDYGGAVQDGKVISQGEYDEQIEFAEIIAKNANGVDRLQNPEFLNGLAALDTLIKEKGSSEAVARLARKLQQDAIQLAGIAVAPTTLPDLELGAKLYQQSCITCHGPTGRGDGLAGAGLDPKPANFHEPDLVWKSAPYKFYNTTRMGVPGTGMVAFSGLSDHEVWSIAYYLKSLPYEGAPLPTAKDVTAIELATMTDAELAQKLVGESDDVKTLIASLRAHGSNGAGKDPLSVAESLLDQSVDAVKRDNYTRAQTLAINAYLQGIEPIEPKMRANLPGFVEQIESLMAEFRSSLSKKESVQILEVKKREIFNKLGEARKQFRDAKMSPGVAFGAAFSIFLREGFEAVLIIIVLLTILRAMNQPGAAKWVHGGWLAAVGVGVIAWFASGSLLEMSGLSRELMEGAISLFAVAVLIYVGFYLHRYTEMKRWRTFLEKKLKHGLTTGSFVGLALVSFLAVFREAFEVVLFLRAIWIDLDSSGQTVASMGVFSSAALLVLLSYFAVKESKNLPIARLFRICSWTMMILAVVLSGKGAHSLQEAGFIDVTSVPIPVRMDLLGIYPSYQTLFAQLVIVALLGVLLFKDRKASHAH